MSIILLPTYRLSSENLLGCALQVFFGFSMLLPAVNIGLYQSVLAGAMRILRDSLYT